MVASRPGSHPVAAVALPHGRSGGSRVGACPLRGSKLRVGAEEDLQELQQLALRRDRLSAALEQAQFELERREQQLRDDGVPEDAIRRALGEATPKPRPRLVKASFPPRQSQPARIDGRAEGFWRDD